MLTAHQVAKLYEEKTGRQVCVDEISQAARAIGVNPVKVPSGLQAPRFVVKQDTYRTADAIMICLRMLRN